MYKRLRDRGYEVFAVNPNAEEVEGDRCYHDLRSIPDGVDAVGSGRGRRSRTRRCANATTSGIKHVWMHRGPGPEASRDGGRVRPRAGNRRHRRRLFVHMFGPTADLGHKAMRIVFTLSGNVPKEV